MRGEHAGKDGRAFWIIKPMRGMPIAWAERLGPMDHLQPISYQAAAARAASRRAARLDGSSSADILYGNGTGNRDERKGRKRSRHGSYQAAAARAASRRAARLDGAFSGDIRTSSQRLKRDILYVQIQYTTAMNRYISKGRISR